MKPSAIRSIPIQSRKSNKNKKFENILTEYSPPEHRAGAEGLEKNLIAYSITIRTGEGFDLGLKSNLSVLKYLESFECHVWNTEKFNTLGEHIQAGVLSELGPQVIRNKLLEFYPQFSQAQRRNAIKVVKHHNIIVLAGYCLKETIQEYPSYSRQGHQIAFTIDYLRLVYGYCSKYQSLRPPTFLCNYNHWLWRCLDKEEQIETIRKAQINPIMGIEFL